MKVIEDERVDHESELTEDADSDGTLRLIACSDQRRRVLVSLLEGEKSLRELYSELGLSAPAVIHTLHDLEGRDFVRADNRRYALTFIGRAVTLKIIDLRTMMGVLNEHETFWVGHDTSGIPDHLLGMMLLLRDSTVFVSSQADFREAFQRGIAFFEGANAFRFVSAAQMPDAAHFLNTFASDGVPLQLVLTDDLLDELIEHADLARVAKTLGERCQLYVLRHDPKLTLALSDKIMTLMLARLDGPIDLASTLVARSKDGVIWGTALFNHFAQASEMVSL
jgi:predicted transcriptional regulator